MPISGQIIPKYLVPHIETYINDNTVTLDPYPTESVSNAPRLLCIFASAKGEDGVLKSIDNVPDYLAEYGTPNYNLYGQPCYMPYIALASGNARCFCMRVMPETATYANVIVSAHTIIETDAITGEEQFKVKFVATPIADLTDKSGFMQQMQSMAILPPEVNASGYNVFPLFAVNSKGRGQYGNSFRVRITGDDLMNNENNFINYIFEVLDNSSGSLTRAEQHRGCFDYNAVVDNESLLLDDVLSDPDAGSKKINIATYIEGFENLYAAYRDFIISKGETPDEFNECDLLFGVTKDTLPLNRFVIDVASTDSVGLDSTIGIALDGGDDSTFASNYTPANPGVDPSRQDNIDAAYIKAFNGEYDFSVRSKRSAPCELILDANYSENVKSAMVEAALKRYDARCIVDAGIIYTKEAAINWSNSSKIASISDPIISKEVSSFNIRDPFTGRSVPMTMTYFIAANLPSHYVTKGNHIPFVGSEYARLTNYVRGSVRPEIDADDNETREVLYNNRVNFLECIGEDNYIRGVQGTSQKQWSDLSEENNSAVLLEMKRMIEDMVSSRLYNFASEDDRTQFTKDAKDMFYYFTGTKVKEFDVYFDMTPFEEARSIIHCYLSATFRTISKRGIIEIDINKRV